MDIDNYNIHQNLDVRGKVSVTFQYTNLHVYGFLLLYC